LLRDGETVPVTSKVFDLLLLLIEQSGQVLHKDQMMKALWPDTVVEENNLTQQKSPDLVIEPFDTEEVKVRVYGNTAVVTGRFTQK